MANSDHTFSRRRVLLQGGWLGGGLLAAGALDDRTEALPSVPGAGPSVPDKAGSGRVGPPEIVTRSEWGADESLRSRQVYGYAPIRKIVVHHTAGPSYDGAAAVRRTYRYHALHRGMGDIAYNFLIGPDGDVFEGRWARKYPAGTPHDGVSQRGRGVVGGHSLHTNAGSCGICVIGDFNSHQPTKAALRSLVDVLAWKSAVHHIDPLGEDLYIDMAGNRRTFKNIVGHNVVRATTCPGRNLRSLMPWIRSRVAKEVGSFPERSSDMRRLTILFHRDGRVTKADDAESSG